MPSSHSLWTTCAATNLLVTGRDDVRSMPISLISFFLRFVYTHFAPLCSNQMEAY